MYSETVHLPKVSREGFDFFASREVKHEDLPAHRDADDGVEGGRERGEGQRAVLLWESVEDTAIVYLLIEEEKITSANQNK